LNGLRRKRGVGMTGIQFRLSKGGNQRRFWIGNVTGSSIAVVIKGFPRSFAYTIAT
jgi:hypothetical protein